MADNGRFCQKRLPLEIDVGYGYKYSIEATFAPDGKISLMILGDIEEEYSCWDRYANIIHGVVKLLQEKGYVVKEKIIPDHSQKYPLLFVLN